MNTYIWASLALVVIVGVNVAAAKADVVRKNTYEPVTECIKVKYHQQLPVSYSNDGYLPDCF